MRVIDPPAVDARPVVTPARTALFEGLGLAAATLTLAAGLFLTYTARTKDLKGVEADLAGARLVHLGRLRDASQLAAHLPMFETTFERSAAARLLFQRATSDRPLEHVGGLADVAMDAADVRKDRRLVELRARLDRRPGLARVPVLTAADLAALKRSAIVRTPAEYAARLRTAVSLFFVAFWLAWFVRWRLGASDDPLLLPAVMTLSGIGFMCMLTLRDPLRDTFIASRFAIGTAAGVAALVALSRIDFEASPLRRTMAAPLAGALALALALVAFGSGPGASGAKVNLLGAQPVEAIRLLVILALAAYFARRVEFLRELSHAPIASRWWRAVRPPRWKDVRPVLVAMAVVLSFFFLQKDLGPALALSFVFLGLYGVARGKLVLVMAGIATLFAAFLVAHELGVPATVRQRVAIWIDPWTNGAAGGDQIAHGLWALASGGAWGTGAGLGDPQLIPAAHTDFVLAVVGEELGLTGLVVVAALYALISWRCLRAALRAPGDYTAFLAIGVSLGLTVQAFVIASGLVGILPLSGVVTPFLSYGRSSMIANCAAIGMVLGITRRTGAVRPHLAAPVRVLGWVLGIGAVAVVGRAAWIQVVRADDVVTAASLGEQADGAMRFQYNPRLVAAARLIDRGTIFDRNHLPLATSRPDEIQDVSARYAAAHVPLHEPCAPSVPRCYPLGGLAFHVLGDATYQTNWAARNSSFLERDEEARLKGFDDRPRTVEVRNPRTGRMERTILRDYHELLPLFRARGHTDNPRVQKFLAKDRDAESTLDARLQLRAASALARRIEAGRFTRGAAVVLDVESGDVLAAVSYPWPAADDLRPREAAAVGSPLADRLLDRPRYGLYPPGSTFKLLVAAAALRTPAAPEGPYMCVRLPDGRVGNYVPGYTRPVRDDPMDTTPHGSVDLRRGLIVSCNAYFAQLALRLGPQPLLDAASLFDIDMSQPATPAALRHTLAQAGYGQGQVLVSPLKMARVAAAIAGQGVVPETKWLAGSAQRTNAPRLLSADDAALVGRYMREVVVSGTGRTLASNATPIAGKTGTAEVDHGRAHSWFAGFAPYGGPSRRRIAFAVIVENAGYGAKAAAPIAGDLVDAARDLGVIR
jgi:cell division protein FtsW (lipid II flippase)